MAETRDNNRSPHENDRRAVGRGGPGRFLITAGPTHEPIDAVRFIGNRSSGRMGIALADEAARRGGDVLLLLGPTHRTPTDSRVRTRRFRTAADLQALLAEEMPRCDVLVMGAAVADFRPRRGGSEGKHRRTEAGLTLELEPTPDLLAGIAQTRRGDQLVVGFALEPRELLHSSAVDKLSRKRLDLIVANPLETMEHDRIEAVVLGPAGVVWQTAGAIEKSEFASELLRVIGEARAAAVIATGGAGVGG